jgi:hypothetical protein
MRSQRLATQIATLVALFGVSVVPLHAAPRDPIGEKANYQLDKNGSRTTSMVSSGSAKASVTEFIPDHDQGPSYNVNLDYDITVQFYGRQTGTAKWAFAEEFFDTTFMANLRENGTYETPDYKMRHEGYADVRNLDGSVYPHCDKVLIYDVKIPDKHKLEQIIYGAAGFNPTAMGNPPVEDLQIRAHIYAGVPVLSAVKLDLSGVVQGMPAKAGFDYKR